MALGREQLFNDGSTRQPLVATGLGSLPVGGPWELVDHNGRMRTDQDFIGRVQVVFFGFTHCPDICPTGLGYIASAVDALGEDEVRDVAPLFVSVDPERDTPALLAQYVPQFHPAIIGLSGTPAQVAWAAAAFRVIYRKADIQGPEAYGVDHTATIWLIGRDGRFAGTLDVHEAPETAIAKLRGLLTRTPTSP